jgi:hypothetical protein
MSHASMDGVKPRDVCIALWRTELRGLKGTIGATSTEKMRAGDVIEVFMDEATSQHVLGRISSNTAAECLEPFEPRRYAVEVCYGTDGRAFLGGGILADNESKTRRKSPWRMSRTRKANQRKRLKAVDGVIDVLANSGIMTHSLVSL